MKKRMIAMLLACILAVSTTACGREESSADNKTSDSPSSSSSSEAVSDVNDESEEPLDPITVSMFLVSGRFENEDSDPTKQYILAELGIDMDVTLSIDNWEQKYSLLVSSQNIPSISYITPSVFYEYAEQGAYADLTDLIRNYPNIVKYISENEAMWSRVSVDGKIYGIPSLNTAGKWNITYRQDWLENLGLSIPETMEEFTEVMRAFTEDDPDGNGVKDTYGFGNWDGNTLGMFYGMFGGASEYYHLNGDTIEIGSISEGYKNALMYYKELYDKGYVDPESLTQKSEQFWQKLAQGKVGSWVGWWSQYHAAYQDYGFGETQPDGSLVLGGAVMGPSGMSGMIASDPVTNVVAISYNAENIDRILEFIDWQLSDIGYRVMRYGVEGEYFTMNGGQLDYFYRYDSDMKTVSGKVVDGDTEVFMMFNRTDIYPEQLLGDTQVQVMAYEGYSTARDNVLLTNEFQGLTSEVFQNKMPDITKYVDEMRIRFILGNESFDNWDSYAAEYIRLGGLEVAESLLVEYNETYDKNATLAEY